MGSLRSVSCIRGSAAHQFRRIRARAAGGTSVRFGSGGGPAPPTFARLPVVSQQLNPEWELIWHDGVAPEVAIDFDAPHVSSGEGLCWWLGGLGFFASIGLLAWVADPPSMKLTTERELPHNQLKEELGGWERAVAIDAGGK